MSKIHSNKQLIGALLAVGGGICWGLSGTMGQFLFQYEDMDSRWLVPIRLGGAAVILLVYSIIRYGAKYTVKPWIQAGERRDLIIYGLFGVSASQFTYFLTIQLSTAAIGTILQDLSPAMIMIYGCIQKKRAPTFRQNIAIVLGLAGIILITTHGNLQMLSVPWTALAAGITCAFCVMIYNVVPEHLMNVYPVLLLQGWAFLMGSIALGLIFHPWTYHYIPSARGVFGIFFVIIVGNVMAFSFYLKGVHLIGPDKSILYGFSEPLTAAVVGTLFLGNVFTVFDAIGFVLVFGMLTIISVKRRQETDQTTVKESAPDAVPADSDESNV